MSVNRYEEQIKQNTEAINQLIEQSKLIKDLDSGTLDENSLSKMLVVFNDVLEKSERVSAEEFISFIKTMVSPSRWLDIACSGEDQELSAGVVYYDEMKRDIKGCYSFDITVKTAPTGTLDVDVKKNGATVFDTRVTIDSTETSSLDATIVQVITNDTVDFEVGDTIEIEIIDPGITTPATGLKMQIKYNGI